MENSPILSNKLTSPIPNWILGLFLVISFIGFLDAAYLTVEHYNRGILPCYIFEGCDQVTASKYSSIGNIPIAFFGAIYYLAIFLSTILFFDTKYKPVLYILIMLPVFGFIFSLWFMYLQIFAIKAICFYCVISAITSTALFILGLLVALKIRARSATVK